MTAVVYLSYARHDKEGQPIPFNMDYYLNTHLPLAEKHWGARGMQSWSVVQFEEDDPSGLQVQYITYWESKGHFEKAYAAMPTEYPELMQGLKHYTTAPPTKWVGKSVVRG